jgi:hypothetical protein
MTDHDDYQRDPPAVGTWLAAAFFVLLVVTALLYGASR